MRYRGSNISVGECIITCYDSTFTEATFYDFNTIHRAGISNYDTGMVYCAGILIENEISDLMPCNTQSHGIYVLIGILLLALLFLTGFSDNC